MQRQNRGVPNIEYFKNIIFGVEDSLVSTVGVLFGIASSHIANRENLLISGIIVIGVEALSMGAGAFLTETSAQEMSGRKRTTDNPIIDGIIMFLSYIVSGAVPLVPYLLMDMGTAKYFSLFFTVVALFFLGYIPQRKLRSAVRMTLVASLAATAGFLIATAFNASSFI